MTSVDVWLRFSEIGCLEEIQSRRSDVVSERRWECRECAGLWRKCNQGLGRHLHLVEVRRFSLHSRRNVLVDRNRWRGQRGTTWLGFFLAVLRRSNLGTGSLVNRRSVDGRWRRGRAGLGSAGWVRMGLVHTSFLNAGLLSTSFLFRLNLRSLEFVIIISVVDVATTLALSKPARAAFELALNVQEMHHFFGCHSATTLEDQLVLNLLQQILVLFNSGFGCGLFTLRRWCTV
jgi:hypothetical protein